MSLIMRFLGASLAPRSPDDERWWWGSSWGSWAATSVAGVPVTADTALKISTVWACVGLLSETIGWLPLGVFRYLGEDGRQRARQHPLYSVLHDQPNSWQTAFEFREMLTGHMLLRGNGYAKVIAGARGAVDQLEPIHPDRVLKIERLPNKRLRYQIRGEDGSRQNYNQEDIFHLRGPSKDGLVGMSVIDYARDSFGLTMAAELYGGRFFRNDSRPGGVLRTDGRLSDPAAKRVKETWEAAHSGTNQNRVAILEEGLQWQQVGIDPESAQFLETREFQAEDVCRWFRVPPHMVGLTSKATSWGSGIEQMGIGFVTYTLMPWLTRWTQAISRDLIIATDSYFADFVVEGLLRGDIGSRYTAYATGRQWGWLSVNDIRRLENMNPVDNGDVYLQPLNMGEAGQVGDTPSGAPKGVGSQGPGASISQEIATGEEQLPIINGQLSMDNDRGEHYKLLALEAAGRVARKEFVALTKAAKRVGEDRGAWAEAVENFFEGHAEFVAQVMQMPLERAETFVRDAVLFLCEWGPEHLGDWQGSRQIELYNLVMGDDALTPALSQGERGEEG